MDTDIASESFTSDTADNDTNTATTVNSDQKPPTGLVERELRKKLTSAMNKVNKEVRMGTFESSNTTAVKPIMGKRNRVEITAKHKREICVYKQYHPKITYDQLAKHCLGKWNLKIGRSTLSDIFRQKEKWLNITPDQEDLLRSRGGRHRKLEVELVKWLANLRKSHPRLALTDKFILHNAKKIGSILNIDQSFSYSKGWLVKFKKRQGLNTKDGKELGRRLSMMEFDTGSSMELSLLEENELAELDIKPNVTDSTKEQSSADESFEPSITHAWSLLGDVQNTTTQTSYTSDSNPSSPQPDSVVIKQEVCSNDGDFDDYNNSECLGNMEVDPEGQVHNDWGSEPHIPDSLCVKSDENEAVYQSNLNPDTSIVDDQKVTPFPVNTSNFVSVQEAKHCAIRCIRFFENHSDLGGDHLDALWNVFHTIDSMPTLESPRQTSIKHFFNKK